MAFVGVHSCAPLRVGETSSPVRIITDFTSQNSLAFVAESKKLTMSEIQARERQELTAQQVKVRLYEAEKKSRVQRKQVADKLARAVITAGGIAIIFSVIAILLLIAAETLPLWKSPVAQPLSPVALGPIIGETNQTLAMGVDEYQEIAYLVNVDGTVDFFSLGTQQLLQRYQVQGLAGQHVTAAYRD